MNKFFYNMALGTALIFFSLSANAVELKIEPTTAFNEAYHAAWNYLRGSELGIPDGELPTHIAIMQKKHNLGEFSDFVVQMNIRLREDDLGSHCEVRIFISRGDQFSKASEVLEKDADTGMITYARYGQYSCQ